MAEPIPRFGYIVTPTTLAGGAETMHREHHHLTGALCARPAPTAERTAPELAAPSYQRTLDGLGTRLLAEGLPRPPGSALRLWGLP